MSSGSHLAQSRKGKERTVDPVMSHSEMAEQMAHFKHQLGALMKARDTEKQKYTEKTDRLQATLSSTQTDLLTSTQTIQSLQSQLSVHGRELSTLREDLLTARTRNDGLQARLSKTSAGSGEDVEREWRRMKVELGKMEKEKMGWEKERLNLLEGLKREKRHAEKAVEDANTLKERLEKDLRKEMRDKIKENEEKNKALIEEVGIAKQLLNAAAHRHSTLWREHQTFQQTAKEQRMVDQSFMRDLHSQFAISLEDRTTLSSELKRGRRSKMENERALLEENSVLRRRLHEERKEFAIWRRTVDDAHRVDEEDMRVLEKTIIFDNRIDLGDDAKLDRLLLEDERDQTCTLIASLRANIVCLESGLSDAQSSLEAATTSLSTTQLHLNTLQSNHSSLQSTHAAMTSELSRLRDDHNMLIKEMKVERGKWEERKEVIRRLGGEVGMMGMAKKALEEECERLREGLSSTQAIEEAYAALQLQHEILLSRMDSYQSEARDMGNLNASLRGFPSDEVVGRVGYVQGLREEVAEMKEALITTKAHLNASRHKVVSLTKELDIYRSQELPLHVKPVTKRIGVSRVPTGKEREALGVSQSVNVGRGMR